MTEIELIIDLHLDNERQGPGSPQETKRALDLIRIDRSKLEKIADIGCGTGGQTLTLAQNTQAEIIAIDLFSEFLTKLENRVQKLGLTHRIKTQTASMENLPFQPEEFDIIWSEGAIYNIGFESGIKNWRKFLKPGGYLAVSEISWLTNSRPKTIEDYWLSQYPQIDTVSHKIKVLESQGYVPKAHFILPPSCWLENYYIPLQQRFEAFLVKHQNSELAQNIVENEKNEIEIYQQFQDYYSYGFYIAQKQ
ncbi:MAG: methyltransferase domain-containing protein [Jaaginema sp. PMC 1079.18]|nr:methyltransferase domain-containing protein [Jaaginema sp. PMC 1080.18]MEC4853252.1 methyltransferase domain-containing protein [Jaaginema sp. PMC 1079.18]